MMSTGAQENVKAKHPTEEYKANPTSSTLRIMV